MIVDCIPNITLYKNLSEDIYKGLLFISEAKSDIPLGNIRIATNVLAIISEYETIKNFERGYEAHQNVIDIQYPIIGRERIKWSPIYEMKINIPYDKAKDRTFYKLPTQGTFVDIGDGVFAIMFPGDGHSPQHCIDQPQRIKKITIKVSI